MATGFRNLAAVFVGVIVALVLLIAVELWSAVVHPIPPDFGGTMEEMCEHVAHYPSWVLAVVVPVWGAIAFLSTWTAKRIGSRGAALVIGLLLVAAVVFNVSMLPYPIWFKISNLVVIPIAVVLANRLPQPRSEFDNSDLK